MASYAFGKEETSMSSGSSNKENRKGQTMESRLIQKNLFSQKFNLYKSSLHLRLPVHVRINTNKR